MLKIKELGHPLDGDILWKLLILFMLFLFSEEEMIKIVKIN